MTDRLADLLRTLRHERSWTLDRLAAESGLSRATLSRLENGQSSPTAQALAALARSFGMTASRLLALAEGGFDPFVAHGDQTERQDPRSGFSIRTVSPISAELKADVLECHLPSGRMATDAAVAVPGREHHLVVLDGALAVQLEGARHHMTAGDCLRFHLRQPATFETTPDRGARFLLVRV